MDKEIKVTEEFLDIAREKLENIIIISEGNDPKDVAKSITIIFLQHMLKYKYNPTKQNGSWLGTIKRTRNEIIDIIKANKNAYNFIRSNLDNLFSKAIKKANNEGNNIKITNINQDDEFNISIDNLLNYIFIHHFIERYTYTDEAKKYIENNYWKGWLN